MRGVSTNKFDFKTLNPRLYPVMNMAAATHWCVN